MGSNVTVKAATETTIAVGPFILIVPKGAVSTGLFALAIGQTASSLARNFSIDLLQVLFRV
jgi:hypothetical protein